MLYNKIVKNIGEKLLSLLLSLLKILYSFYNQKIIRNFSLSNNNFINVFYRISAIVIFASIFYIRSNL